MGSGYVVSAALLVLRRRFFYPLILLYTLALMLAYGATRDGLPIEPIGLAIKADEVALALALFALMRSSRQRPQRE